MTDRLGAGMLATEAQSQLQLPALAHFIYLMFHGDDCDHFDTHQLFIFLLLYSDL